MAHALSQVLPHHGDQRRATSGAACSTTTSTIGNTPLCRDDVGYFHAYYRQERPARKGHNYAFLNIKGDGHYVGTVMSVVQTQVSWFGEGDDLFYVDGAKKPQILGTGSEDYFNDAWGLRDVKRSLDGNADCRRRKARIAADRLSLAYSRSDSVHEIAVGRDRAFRMDRQSRRHCPLGIRRAAGLLFERRVLVSERRVNEGLPEPPYGYERLPFGNATQLTIENSIQDVTTEKGKAIVQKEVDWAKDLLFLEAEGAGSKINIPIDIPEAGQYELIGLIAQAPNYGDYTAFMDGKPMNLDPRKAATSEIPFPGPDVFYNYLPEVYVARDRALGMVDLTKGRHMLTFVCLGKDPRSLGYNFGINDVVLEKVPDHMEDTASDIEAPAEAATAGGAVYRGRPLNFYVSKLKDASGARRITLLYAVGEFGSDGATAVPVLNAALGADDSDVRAAAVSSLAKIGADNPVGIPGLIKGLADPDSQIRGLSALALKSDRPRSVARSAATGGCAQQL